MADAFVGYQTQEGSLEAIDELLAGLIGTAASLRLFQVGFSPSRASVEADFEAQEADFNTYAAAALTWSAAGVDGTGRVFAQSQNVFWQNVSGANPNQIGGGWIHIDDAGPPVVDTALTYFVFANPIAMTAPLAAFGMKVFLTVPDLGGYCVVES